jgi:hypothetical protein
MYNSAVFFLLRRYASIPKVPGFDGFNYFMQAFSFIRRMNFTTELATDIIKAGYYYKSARQGYFAT